MIGAYPYFRKPPYILRDEFHNLTGTAQDILQRILQHFELSTLRIWVGGGQPLMRHKHGLSATRGVLNQHLPQDKSIDELSG